MKFLDTSFLVDYLKGRDYTIEYLEENTEEAFYTTTLSFFELCRGELKTGGNIEELKQRLGWLKQKELSQEAAEKAADIEKELSENGDKVNLADVLIAGTAKTAGAEIVSKDSDFQKMPGIEAFNPEN